MWRPDRRVTLNETAHAQAGEIAVFDKALSYSLVLASAGGERESIKRDSYAFSRDARDRFDRFADLIFFEHLWRRFEAAGDDARAAEKQAFVQRLWEAAREVFDQALPAMPCGSLVRPRAEARARALFSGMVMKNFSDQLRTEEESDAA
jgi:CRISPR system Cascade subunit CasA